MPTITGMRIAAQWLAYALPYRRLADAIADADARLGADVVRYSFIVSGSHRLLLAGLPAHWVVTIEAAWVKTITARPQKSFPNPRDSNCITRFSSPVTRVAFSAVTKHTESIEDAFYCIYTIHFGSFQAFSRSLEIISVSIIVKFTLLIEPR